MLVHEQLPLYRQYPDIQEIGNLSEGPNAQLLADYLRWLVDDPERFESAAENMQWFPPGFHSLLIGLKKEDGDPTHQGSVQLNFYHKDFPGDEEPHAHSRDAVSGWIAPKGTKQILTRYQVISTDAPLIRGLPVQERVVTAMNIGDSGDGRRPVYMPTPLGRSLILPRSETKVASLGTQRFDSTEVHHAGFEGEGVAVSIHVKGPEEANGLNSREGFIHYKGLDEVLADELLVIRDGLTTRLKEQSTGGKIRLAPSTMLYPSEDRVDEIVGRGVFERPTPFTSEFIVLGALKTAQEVAKM